MAASKSEQRDPVLDYLLYAPVGLALEAIDNLPKYVERGRSQVTLGRFVARTAARKGSSTFEAMAERLANDIGQVIVDLFDIDLTPDTEPPGKPTTLRVVESAPADSDLAIAEYDSQAAAQIVKLLAQLEPDELDAIDAYERAGRNRVTILRKIAQLREAG